MVIPTPRNAASERPDYTLLTISRFFAALWVVILHLEILGPAIGAGASRMIHNPFAKMGFLGVSFFYVLSGFILGKLYKDPVIDVRQFYLKRFLRIYPSYFLIVFAIICIPFFVFPRTLAFCAPVLLLFNAWVPSMSQNVLGPAWSLTCEAFFYIVYPFVYRGVLKPSRLMTGFIISLTFVPSIFVLVGKGLDPTGVLVYFPLMHFPSFLVGILFAGFKPIPGKLFYAFVGCMGSIAFAKFLIHDGIPFKVGLAALPFAFLIWALASSNQPDASNRFIKVLILQGNASYVLYLIHFPILVYLRSVGMLNSPVDAILAILIVIASATGLYVAFDRPIHSWSGRLLRRKNS